MSHSATSRNPRFPAQLSRSDSPESWGGGSGWFGPCCNNNNNSNNNNNNYYYFYFYFYFYYYYDYDDDYDYYYGDKNFYCYCSRFVRRPKLVTS